MDGRAIAELLAQVGRLAQGEGLVHGLTPAQWTALRYFARANRFSRTVSAFAEFHATTRGTASQTVKTLVRRGFLQRTRSQRDGRSARLDVTESGREMLVDDPLEVVAQAAGGLRPSGRLELLALLRCIAEQVAGARGKPAFGICASCRHLRGDASAIPDGAALQCGLVDEPLRPAETAQLCVNCCARHEDRDAGRTDPLHLASRHGHGA